MELIHPKDFFNFSGKSVLITGSSTGIGAGIAMRFAQAGADVGIHFNQQKAKAMEIEKQIISLGGKAISLKANISIKSDIQNMFDTFLNEFGKIDTLINNAGIYPRATILEMTEEQWDEVMDTNLRSVFLCTQAAARQMIIGNQGGNVINISSIEAINPALEHSHYVASKAGVMMFTKTAALELGQYNIRVNAIAPALINSPQLPTGWPEGLARFLKKVPLGRVGEPEDIGDACLFLASDAARWITGEQINVDGGVLTNQIY
jgi:NAD(P)-dependent dehydrogenase (short-subunit alcohol dehydrogenase family)